MVPNISSISKTLAQQLRCGGPIFSVKWVPQPRRSTSPFSTSAPAISETQEEHRGSRWSRLLLFVPGAIIFGLGTWQILRRQDKMKMPEYRHNKLGAKPINCNKVTPSNENLDSLVFRKIICKGVFDEEKSIYVGLRSRSISGVTENGYNVITPLMPILNNPESVQSPVLVNRGWVPQSWRNKSSRVSENLEVIGVVRESEKPRHFVPANDPNSCQWFYVDVPAIALACGLPENTIYIEDISEKFNSNSPYPVPKDPNTLSHSSVMPQDHLNYTVT